MVKLLFNKTLALFALQSVSLIFHEGNQILSDLVVGHTNFIETSYQNLLYATVYIKNLESLILLPWLEPTTKL